MVTVENLDVTKIEPRLKHPTIFKHFDELEPGEGFILENDHDPKPLYYQLLSERGNIFSWEYLEQGPQWFKIRITKNPVAQEEQETVGSIVAKDIRKADVLKAKGIDFCCGGNKTLKEAGEEVGVSESELREALAAVEKTPLSPSQDFNKWELDFLSDYIINTHHRYIKDNAENINNIAIKVAQHHGENHPELKTLAQSVHKFLQELLDHTLKEERVLFPAIKNGVAKKRNADANVEYEPGNIEQPIIAMQQEHDTAGEDLAYFRKLTNNYLLPADACNSYNYLFEKLKEFENDVTQHIHLENNILFPKSLELDKELSNVSA